MSSGALPARAPSSTACRRIWKTFAPKRMQVGQLKAASVVSRIRQTSAAGLEVTSVTPGRIRWRARAIVGDEARAAAIREQLQETVGVLSSQVNPRTGSILVLHDDSFRSDTAAAAIMARPASPPCDPPRAAEPGD